MFSVQCGNTWRSSSEGREGMDGEYSNKSEGDKRDSVRTASSKCDLCEEKESTIKKCYEDISVLQEQVALYQETTFQVEEMLQNEGLPHLLEFSSCEQIVSLLKERSHLCDKMEKDEQQIAELEEQKAISDNLIEELELDKLELIEEWNLHKEKSAEEYNAKMEEMEAEIDLLSSEVETLTMRNQELQQSLDKKEKNSFENGDDVTSEQEPVKQLQEELQSSQQREVSSRQELAACQRSLEKAQDTERLFQGKFQELESELVKIRCELQHAYSKLKDQENKSPLNSTTEIERIVQDSMLPKSGTPNLETEMQERLLLTKEELEKNKQYVNSLQLQLKEAMTFCRNQSDSHQSKEQQLTNEIERLRLELSRQKEQFLKNLANSNKYQSCQGNKLSVENSQEQVLSYKMPVTELISKDLLERADQVVVCRTPVVRFATLLECGAVLRAA